MTTPPSPRPKSLRRPAGLSVFDYTDYRSFLRDYYEAQKKTNKAFSYRMFASRAEINSSGFYKNVVDGKRSLSRSHVVRFAEAMGLKNREIEYFEALVSFNDADTVDEKKLYFERMMDLREPGADRIEAQHHEYYSQWYYAAVRELVRFSPRLDGATAAAALDPPIRPDQGDKALRILAELGFIAQDDKGRWQQTSGTISTGAEVTALNVASYQVATMDLAREAIDRHPAEFRDVSTLTLCISDEGYKVMKEELIAFRRKLLNIEQRFAEPDRVYQLNLQFFPLSRIPGSTRRILKKKEMTSPPLNILAGSGAPLPQEKGVFS